ncbi:MAG TPA: hypothetical protein VK172_10265 [Lentimicrobium sp.]|nr:hypothetical protein [Lentimicrobium sp.]
MAIKRTEKEIDEQISRAMIGVNNGTKYAGMSYEDGVRYALEWVVGDSDEKPMEDE